jgi:hypothetical protein
MDARGYEDIINEADRLITAKNSEEFIKLSVPRTWAPSHQRRTRLVTFIRSGIPILVYTEEEMDSRVPARGVNGPLDWEIHLPLKVKSGSYFKRKGRMIRIRACSRRPSSATLPVNSQQDRCSI